MDFYEVIDKRKTLRFPGRKISISKPGSTGISFKLE